MKVEPSTVDGVELIGPADEEFSGAISSLLGREPDGVLRPALPFSVIARNRATRAIALLGIRFDMLGATAKPYSVIHFADTLRNPGSAALAPDAMRLVCVEQLYTDLVLRKENVVDPRGPMNLLNLRKALQVKASVDCAAFDDGHFAGRDSLGAFERLAGERAAEAALIERVLDGGAGIEQAIAQAVNERGVRSLARRLSEAFAAGGAETAQAAARVYRLRIPVWR